MELFFPRIIVFSLSFPERLFILFGEANLSSYCRHIAARSDILGARDFNGFWVVFIAPSEHWRLCTIMIFASQLIKKIGKSVKSLTNDAIRNSRAS